MTGDFFVAPAPEQQRTPAPHEGRVEFLTKPMRESRWRATVTTFGPWIKVPISLYLVVRPIIILTRQIVEGTLPTGPYEVFALFSYAVFLAIGLGIVSSLWRKDRY